jgi:hypothetical protein
MRAHYRVWLTRQKYDPGTIATQLARAGRVEKHYGDLDQLFAADRLESVIANLRYTTEDQRSGRPNPSKIPFEGDIRTNSAARMVSALSLCSYGVRFQFSKESV